MRVLWWLRHLPSEFCNGQATWFSPPGSPSTSSERYLETPNPARSQLLRRCSGDLETQTTWNYIKWLFPYVAIESHWNPLHIRLFGETSTCFWLFGFPGKRHETLLKIFEAWPKTSGRPSATPGRLQIKRKNSPSTAHSLEHYPIFRTSTNWNGIVS